MRRDLAWGALDDNSFGTEEMLAYCREVGAEPYLNLNLSTGTVDEALAWLEYCNGREDLPEVCMRQKGSHPDPHDVRLWGLGNENWGWGQHMHSSAAAYAERAREWGKLLRWADPRVELVAVGSRDLHDWNWTVLRDAGRFVDFLSLHCYWGTGTDPYAAALRGPLDLEVDIEAAWGMCLAAQRLHRLARPPRLAIDEWGIWSRTAPNAADPQTNERIVRMGFGPRAGFPLGFAETPDLKDALGVAAWVHLMWRHADKIALANQSELVNVITSPLATSDERVVRHTVYYSMAALTELGGPIAIDVQSSSDAVVEGASPMGLLDPGATLDPESGRVVVSIVNRHPSEEVEAHIEGVSGEAGMWQLAADSPTCCNDLLGPERVQPVEGAVVVEGRVVLPPHSHTILVFG